VEIVWAVIASQKEIDTEGFETSYAGPLQNDVNDAQIRAMK